jgi:hypothetical protein
MREESLGEILAAQSLVSSARALLARPRTCNVDECAALLREAQGHMERLRDRLPKAGPAGRELREQAATLQREIRQSAALLDQAARFGANWLARLRAMSSGYTAAGSPAPLQTNGLVSVLG